MEITSIVAAVVSIVIGIFAIWLSLTFYKMSSRNMENVIEASKGLQANMNRLEALFNKLYQGTISIPKESVPETPKQPWPEAARQEDLIRDDEVEKRAERKVEELRKALEKAKSGVPEKQVIQETRTILGTTDRAFVEPKKADGETFKGSIRERIEKQINFYQHRGYKGIISEFLMDDIKADTPLLTVPDIEPELRKMKEEAIIDWEGDKLGPNTHIEFKK